MALELKVPEVGESITEVVIGSWKKREGDAVATDDAIVEIESDKATVELPAPTHGTVTKILKAAGICTDPMSVRPSLRLTPTTGWADGAGVGAAAPAAAGSM